MVMDDKGDADPALPGDRALLLAQTFVVLAAAGDATNEILEVFARVCVDVLDVDGTALVLVPPRGGAGVVAASHRPVGLLAELQLKVGEGPVLEAIRGGVSVASVQPEDAAVRWPRYAPALSRAGFRSVAVLPLRSPSHDQTVGGLQLLSLRPGGLDQGAQHVGQAFAASLATSILRVRAQHARTALTEQLQRALNSRVVIEQAKGMLAERHGISMTDAFEAVRTYSRNHNRKLADVAAEVVSRELEPLMRMPGQNARRGAIGA